MADKGIAATYDTDKTIDPYLTINGGNININSTGGEGIESKSVLTINNGTITTKTTDDGLRPECRDVHLHQRWEHLRLQYVQRCHRLKR